MRALRRHERGCSRVSGGDVDVAKVEAERYSLAVLRKGDGRVFRPLQAGQLSHAVRRGRERSACRGRTGIDRRDQALEEAVDKHAHELTRASP